MNAWTQEKNRRLTASLGVAAVMLALTQGAMAAPDVMHSSAESEQELLRIAFLEQPESDVLPLDEAAMDSTQGALWPWIIGVAALDLSLASFFWGTYVPTVTGSGGGTCTSCYFPSTLPY